MKEKRFFVVDGPLIPIKPKPLTPEARIRVQLKTFREKFRLSHFRKVVAALKAKEIR